VREIKFRYVYKNKKDEDFQYDFFTLAQIESGYAKDCINVMKGDGYTVVSRNQYTGLIDKNGKEGYESDILATPISRAAIRFGEYSQPMGREKHIGFYLEFEYEDDCEVYRKDIGYWMPQSVIIGTLYDNPELLKEDKAW
jgi:hypothetical protein